MGKSLVASLVILVATLGVACADPSPSPAAGLTPTSNPTSTPTPTPTPVPTPTATPTPTPTHTPSPTPSPTLTPAPLPDSAQDVLDESIAAMLAVGTFHFDIDARVTLDVQGQPLEVPLIISGDFQAPDRSRAALSVDLFFFSFESQLNTVGDTLYMADPDTGEWEEVTGRLPPIAGPGGYLGAGGVTVAGLALLGVEDLDDDRVYHLRGTIPAGTFQGSSADIEVDYWVGVKDDLVRQITARGVFDLEEGSVPFLPPGAAGNLPIAMTMLLSDHGKPLDIEVPIAAPDLTTQTAGEILEAAAAAIQASDSFHFDLELSMSVDAGGFTLDLPMSLQGDFQAPDRTQGTLSIDLGFFSVESQVISIGDTHYATNPDTGQWEFSTEPATPFGSVEEFVGPEISRIRDLTVVGQETLDGVESIHLGGLVSAETLGDDGVEGELEVDYWIGAQNGLLLQMTAKGELEIEEEDFFFGGGEMTTTTLSLTLKLSDFGKPVSIEAPEVTETAFGAEGSELGSVQTAMDSMMADKGAFAVETTTDAINDWSDFPTGAAVAPLYPDYFPNVTSTYYYCWDSVGLITEQDTSPVVCPVSSPFFPSEPAIVLPGSMAEARSSHIATVLPDGSVLVSGGENQGLTVLNSAELYYPTTTSWEAASRMSERRAGHTASRFEEGDVLVVGGLDNLFNVLASAEIYDPYMRTWSLTGEMAQSRSAHTATLLQDGSVLVVAGVDNFFSVVKSVEAYDPAGGTWSQASSMAEGRARHSSALLADGRVLVAGGSGENFAVLDSAELYDPTTDLWSSTDVMAHKRQLHTATLLRDGRVLVAGGQDEDFLVVDLVEFYEPANGLWSSASANLVPRHSHTATLLGDGKVLVAGGEGDFETFSSVELYDPSTGTWSLTGEMAQARSSHTATLLADGRVLVAGGLSFFSPLASAELYDPTIGTWSPAGEGP